MYGTKLVEASELYVVVKSLCESLVTIIDCPVARPEKCKSI